MQVSVCYSDSDVGGCSQGCYNTIGSRVCFCADGYSLNADGVTCDDVDECADDTDYCWPDEGGDGGTEYCTNTDGGYTCTCPSSFSLKVSR
jgi:hypothetical protein